MHGVQETPYPWPSPTPHHPRSRTPSPRCIRHKVLTNIHGAATSPSEGTCASSTKPFLFDYFLRQLGQPSVPQRFRHCGAGGWAGGQIQSIKGRRSRWAVSLRTMGKRRPSHIHPDLWKEYLRRYRWWAWWVGDVDGNHPDYPGLPSSSQHDGPTPSRSPSPSQSESPSPSTSQQLDHLSPLWASLASYPLAPSLLSATSASSAQPGSHASHPATTQPCNPPSQGT